MRRKLIDTKYFFNEIFYDEKKANNGIRHNRQGKSQSFHRDSYGWQETARSTAWTRQKWTFIESQNLLPQAYVYVYHI